MGRQPRVRTGCSSADSIFGVCPLLDQSGQSPILARSCLSANDPERTFGAEASRSQKFVKEEIDGGNLAVPGDDEIGSGVSRRLARAAGHPADPPAIADHLRRGEQLISEVRMSSLDHASDAVDLIATAVSAVGFVELRRLRGRFRRLLRVDARDQSLRTRHADCEAKGRYSVGHGFSRVGVEFGLHCLVPRVECGSGGLRITLHTLAKSAWPLADFQKYASKVAFVLNADIEVGFYFRF